MSLEYPCVYYDNQKCKKFEEPGYVSWCVLGPCSHETPSNADHIRSMTDEELAEFIYYHKQENCSCCELAETDGSCTETVCGNATLRWLKQPYKEET